MPRLAPLAQPAMMRPFPLPRTYRPLHLNTAPLLKPVRDSLRIRLVVQARVPEAIARLAALVIHSSVIFCAAVHADCDGDSFARPSLGSAAAVPACEAPHDVGVVGLGAGAGVVGGVEGEVEIGFGEETRDVGVQGGVYGVFVIGVCGSRRHFLEWESWNQREVVGCVGLGVFVIMFILSLFSRFCIRRFCLGFCIAFFFFSSWKLWHEFGLLLIEY